MFLKVITTIEHDIYIVNPFYEGVLIAKATYSLLFTIYSMCMQINKLLRHIDRTRYISSDKDSLIPALQ